MIAVSSHYIGIQKSGHDLGILPAEFGDTPLSAAEMDAWHVALAVMARDRLGTDGMVVTRAYYDKEAHVLVLGGHLAFHNLQVPLVFRYAPNGGGDEWEGTFDIDDGFCRGDVTATMKAGFNTWLAHGRPLAEFPFLPWLPLHGRRTTREETRTLCLPTPQ